MSKEYFTDHNVAFEEFNVATDLPAREEMFKKSGQMGVPVIDIDGTVTVGFNQEKLAELLGIKE
jgi:glutaredoxin